MQKFDWTGFDNILRLLESGLNLPEICDRYGNAAHADAEPFLKYHRQAKRMLIKHIITGQLT